MNASIIIRTKNEETWLGHCLQMIHQQSLQDFEIIIVDNQSTDATVAVAKRHGVDKLITIDQFFPGYALNRGIRESHGEYIVCLSAHCVPRDEHWLKQLLTGFGAESIAGVYGRQLPVTFSSDADKRDLLITFGLDRRLQIKDTFFHNANSAVRRSVWEKIPFNETATNIEDRVWAKEVISQGYCLAYEPEAAVYHHHGIHQNNDYSRAKSVVSVLERFEAEHVNGLPPTFRPEATTVDAIVPIAGEIKGELGFRLLDHLLEQLEQSSFIKRVYVLADTPRATALAAQHQALFIEREGELNQHTASLEDVLRYTVEKIEQGGHYPEAILYTNYLFPFRPDGLFNNLVSDLQYKGLDTVFPGYIDYGNYWTATPEGSFVQIGDGLKPRDQKQPLYQGLYGLGCITRTPFVRRGSLIGRQIGIIPLENDRYTLKYTNEQSGALIEALWAEDPVAVQQVGHASPVI